MLYIKKIHIILPIVYFLFAIPFPIFNKLLLLRFRIYRHIDWNHRWRPGGAGSSGASTFHLESARGGGFLGRVYVAFVGSLAGYISPRTNFSYACRCPVREQVAASR